MRCVWLQWMDSHLGQHGFVQHMRRAKEACKAPQANKACFRRKTTLSGTSEPSPHQAKRALQSVPRLLLPGATRPVTSWSEQ